MSKITIPEGYKARLSLIETEVAIKLIKDTFERRLAEQLRLTRVSAPLFLLKNTGLNDNLSGKEKPVSFTSFELNNDDEIEQELILIDSNLESNPLTVYETMMAIGRKEELLQMKDYDYIVVNNSVEEAAEQIRNILNSESLKTKNMINMVEKELKL